MKRRHPPSHCIQPRSVLLRRGDALFPLIQVFTASDQLTKYWGAKTKQAQQAFVSYKLWIWSKLKYFKITHLWGFLHLFARKGLAATYPCLPPTAPAAPKLQRQMLKNSQAVKGFTGLTRQTWMASAWGWFPVTEPKDSCHPYGP